MQVFLHLVGKKPHACQIFRQFLNNKKKKIGAGSSLNISIESFDVCWNFDNPEIILRVAKGVACLGIVSCIDVYFFLKAELVQKSCINDSFSLT